MKKTAMMELKNKLQFVKSIHNIETGVDNPLVELNEIIKMIYEALPTERQNIEDAYSKGFDDGIDDTHKDEDCFNSDYFNQTYEQK